MSGRGVARIVIAPIVIAFAIMVLRPVQWLGTLPVIASLDNNRIPDRLLETAAAISSDTVLSAAAIDESGPEVPPPLAETVPPETVALAPFLPLPALPEIEETASVVVAEKSAPSEPVQESVAVTAEPPAAASLTPPSPKSLEMDAPAEQPAPGSLAASGVMASALPTTPLETTNAAETKIVVPDKEIAAPAQAAVPPPAEAPAIARAHMPEEDHPGASHPLPAPAIDTSSLAADHFAAEEVKVASEYKPSPVEPEDRYIDDAGSYSPASPSQASNVVMSSPLKLRALTRADIPPPGKFASLGTGVHSDTASAPALSGILQPEHQRVAHDAPPVTERPKSIGKRYYIDETKYAGLGSPEALLEALRHVGSNAKSLGLPAKLWCADFMNMVLRKSGLKATGSRAAKSYLQYGQQIDEPRVGALAIFTRGKRGGHVGIVRGTDGNGNPIIVSGNYSNRVAEAVYPKSRVIAYVVPK